MIAADFEYHRPETVLEATAAHRRLRAEGKEPLYYGGGTEIISRARLGQLHTRAVVDIKAIAECNTLDCSGDRIVVGAGLTLAQICAADPWPLLSAAARRVADHTSRCKITLGGNIAGSIQYREAVLPLLLVDSEAVIGSGPGLRRAPFKDVFDGTLHLEPGEFLAQISVAKADAAVPAVSVKRTRLDFIDYPLLTISALRTGTRIRAAFAGLCDHPFRCQGMDDALSETRTPAEARAERAVLAVPAPIVSDLHGSADYRRFVLRNTLVDVLRTLEG